MPISRWLRTVETLLETAASFLQIGYAASLHSLVGDSRSLLLRLLLIHLF
jgi:hypothetical protein